MKGKMMKGEKEHDTKAGPNSRKETEKVAHEGDSGFNKGGATKAKKRAKVEGKKARHRHDKRDRRGKFAKGGAVESDAHGVKMRPGYKGLATTDKEDD